MRGTLLKLKNKIFVRILGILLFLFSCSAKATNIKRAIEDISSKSSITILEGIDLLFEDYSEKEIEAKEHEQVVRQIEDLINNENLTIRREATKFYLSYILFIRNSTTKNKIFKLLKDKDVEVRKMTLDYIAKNVSASEYPGIYKEVELIYLNRKNDKDLRMYAVMTLFGQNNIEYIEHYVEAEEDLEIRNMIIEQLSYRGIILKEGFTKNSEEIIRLLSSRKVEDNLSGFEILKQSYYPRDTDVNREIVNTAVILVNHKNEKISSEAFRFLLDANPLKASDFVLKFINEKAPEIREMALRSITSLINNCPISDTKYKGIITNLKSREILGKIESIISDETESQDVRIQAYIALNAFGYGDKIKLYKKTEKDETVISILNQIMTVVYIRSTDMGLSQACTLAGPVNTTNGNMYHGITDINASSIGMPLTFSRSYNSMSEDHGLASGWVHNQEPKIEEAADGSSINITGEDGGVMKYQRYESVSDVTQGAIAATIIKRPAGVYSILSKNDDGTYTWKHKSGRVDEFDTDGNLQRTRTATNRHTLMMLTVI